MKTTFDTCVLPGDGIGVEVIEATLPILEKLRRGAGFDLRFRLELYAGVRPARAIPGVPPALADPRARDIDLVLIRESTEGLFASRGKPGSVTCVDKANAFVSMAFFRKIFDEVAARHPGVAAKHHYVDATALDLVRTACSNPAMARRRTSPARARPSRRPRSFPRQ